MCSIFTQKSECLFYDWKVVPLSIHVWVKWTTKRRIYEYKKRKLFFTDLFLFESIVSNSSKQFCSVIFLSKINDWLNWSRLFIKKCVFSLGRVKGEGVVGREFWRIECGNYSHLPIGKKISQVSASFGFF